MKLLLLLTLTCIMAAAMNAQDFHGVSIGGTVESPTLINNSGTPVMAYSAERITSNGLNRIFDVVNLHGLVRGEGIAGDFGLYTGFRKGFVNHVTGQMVEEGDPVRWELKGVLFADGRHYGGSFRDFYEMFGNFRSFARSLQYSSGYRRSVLEHTSTVLVTSRLIQDQVELAKALLELPESDQEAAIDRLAAMPDVKKEGK